MRQPQWRILIPAALIALGGASIFLAVAADLLGMGGGGFGAKQVALLITGGLGVLSGLGLALPAGWTFVSAWRTWLGSDSRPAGILLLAVWFGLLTGWGQMLVLLIRKTFQGKVITMGLDFGWMIPLANLVLFVAVGVVLHLLHKRWPHLVSMHTATFLLAWLAGLGLLLLIPRVSSLALLVLAAGISTQLVRLARKHDRGFANLVRFTVGWPALLRRPPKAAGAAPSPVAPASPTGATAAMLPSRRQFLLGATSGIAAVALGTQAGLAVTERRSLARLVRPATRMPNVLLIVLDTVRAQSMSLYGYGRSTTPNLERLAAQGTLFTRAIAPSSWTLPSHASMLTGRFPHEYIYGWGMPVFTSHPFLAEILSGAGYMTAGFSANLLFCGHAYGIQRGFAHYEDYRITPGQAFMYTSFGPVAESDLRVINPLRTYRNFGRKCAEQVNADFLRWLPRAAQQPFFAFLNYFDAHDPYLPPSSFGLKFASHNPRGFVTRHDANGLTEEDLRELRDAYDGSIAYLDHQLGALIDALAASDVLNNTVVIIASDHGEQFGEHNLLWHGNSLYRSLIHVPLLLLGPGQIPTGLVVHEPVGLTDLPATVLDLTGIPRTGDLPGGSLARYWQGSMARSETAIYSEDDIRWDAEEFHMPKGRYRSLVSSEYHYILQPDGKEELYSFEADPEEVKDLSGTQAGREAIERLRVLLPTA